MERSSKSEVSYDVETGEKSVDRVIKILFCSYVFHGVNGHDYFEQPLMEVTGLDDDRPVFLLGELPASDVPEE